MDQYPYSIPPAAGSYPYTDGTGPDKTATVDGVAQVPQNPFYLGGPAPDVAVPTVADPRNSFPGVFSPAEVAVPNGMVAQPTGFNPYYPEQVPQQQQPIQYSQQDYAREANVAPVEYLPEVGLPAGPDVGSVQQQIEQSSVVVAGIAAAPVFGGQVQAEPEFPPAVASAEATEDAGIEQGQPIVEAETTPTPTDASQLPIPPTENNCVTESTPVPAPDALDSSLAAEPTLPAVASEASAVTPDASTQINTDPEISTVVDLLDGGNSQDDDCIVTSPTPPPPATARPDGWWFSTKKKRRRIVQLNDDDSDEEDGQERMELLRSPEPEAELEDVGGKVVDGDGGEDNGKEGEDEGRSESRNEDDDEAPSIFQNVVMIPVATDAADAHKRKKIRVLDSDDDDDEEPVAPTTVDDIGLTGEEMDELNPGGGDEMNGEDGDLAEGLEQIVAMDAPIVDPTRMLEEGEDDDEDEDENGSDREKDKEDGSDAEANGSDVEEPEVEEEEEEEEAEEGVEMITAEDDAGEAIGIATDDEKELVDEDQPAEADSEPEERGSDQEEVLSDPEASRSRSTPEDQDSRSSSNSNQRRDDDDDDERSDGSDQDSSDRRKKKRDSGAEDEVVCQNDLELNTISLLTDEEDDNQTPLPTPKKELPVVRIVNIKKELLDESRVKKERYDPSSYYQQQQQIKQQQIAARKKEKKKKRERNFDNNDPFGAWSSSSSEDEFIPNDIYFGTADRVFTASTKIRCQRQKQQNERYSAKYGRSSSGYKRSRYDSDSDGEDRRKRKQKLDQLSRLNLPSYQQAQLQTMIKKKKKRRQDRFYDKSQDIPNDIYFGNVNVPLHILYAFGDSSSDDDRANMSWRSESSSSKSGRYSGGPGSRGPYKKSASSYSHDRLSISPSSDRSVQAMREYLKIAGFKHVKFHKLWEGCKSNQERANAILRLMQEKGLEGEPTVAKCRELRKQLQMEREAQVLDTSLIIDSGEGRITRRSKRNHSDPSDPNAPSTSGTTMTPESSEAIQRIRSLVDPDSDGE